MNQDHALDRVAVIAVVEDDLHMRQALASLVELFDYEGHIFEGPEMLLSGFAAGQFDCVISDMRMPGMDGLELQRRLKLMDPQLPVIFVTSYDDAATRSRAIDQGAKTVLTKPVSAVILQEEIAAALAG